MDNIININCVDDYNQIFGLETLHPLVSIIDLSKSESWPTHFTLNYGVYSVFLKDTKCGDIRYGRKLYDYREGTIVSFAPGQIAKVEMDADYRPTAKGILFHPDIIRGTSLGQDIKQYSFFSYESTKALHLSEREKNIILDCFSKIQQELEHPIDKHSKNFFHAILSYCSIIVFASMSVNLLPVLMLTTMFLYGLKGF